MMKSPEPEVRTVSAGHWRRRTLLSFAALLMIIGAIWGGFRWIGKQKTDAGTPAPLRVALSANEAVFSNAFDSSRLAKTYPVSAAVKKVRVNGSVGLRGAVDTAAWQLLVLRAPGDTLRVSMAEIKALPKKDIVFDFKCIEGWSQVTHWAGVPLKTFLERYRLQQQEKQRFIGMETPDGAYYVGIDMASALHPQTLLCYEMNGAPLPMNQGYPLRLIIPVKYGVKHLKRVGTLRFSNDKPKDYWAERGYDYYTGH